MAMQDPWAGFEPVGQAAPAAPAGPITVGTPRPRLPAPQTTPQAALDVEQLEAARLENERRRREAAAAGTGGDTQATEGERRAAAFLRNAFAAARDYDASGIGPPSAARAFGETVLGPTVMNTLPEIVGGSSPEREQALQRQLAFTNAMLRFESGANAPEVEVSRYVSQYFPTSGASEEQQANLRDARIRGVRSLLGAAGRAIDPQLRQEVEAWLAQVDRPNAPSEAEGGPPAIGSAPPAAPPPGQPSDEQMTTVPQRIVEPTQGDRVTLSQDQYRSEPDPTLAGVNARVNDMIKRGATASQLADFYRSVGIPLDEVMPQTIRSLRWRQQHPNYRGDYGVNIDDRLVPMTATRSAINQISQSPIGAAGIAAGNAVTGNRLDNLVELGGGSGELANIGMNAVRENNPYSSLAGDIAGGVGLYGAGRAAVGGLSRAIGRAVPGVATGTFSPAAIAGDAALGGYIASGSSGTDVFDPAAAAQGAAFGVGGGMAGRGAINTAGRLVSPTGGSLAPAYAEGVQPTMGQRAGGVIDRAEQAFASVPLVGGIQRGARNRAVEQWQAGAFNQALGEIGERLPKGVRTGTAAHAYMQQAFNTAYNRARSGMQFAPDGQFAQEFGQIQQTLAALPDASQRAFEVIVRGVGNRLQAGGGSLTGDAYKRAVSAIGQKVRAIRRNPQGDSELADALEDFQTALDNGARRHSTPEAVAALDAADRGYARAVLLEEAGRRAGGEVGEFTGKQLEAAIRGNSGRRSRQMLRGEAPLQDYAAAGVRLGNSVPDSGTAERLMTATGTIGGLGSLAHFVDPITLTPWAANTLGNLPGIRQGVNAVLAPNRQALDPVRQALLERAYYGSLIGAGPAAASVGGE